MPSCATADPSTGGASAVSAPSPRTHRRFDRTARLLGEASVGRLGGATVTIFGVGGVGAAAAEALARTGVGRLILVDFDRICVTNTNRQVHAMKGTLGKRKVEVMAERLRAINPDATVEARAEFYSAASAARLLVPEPDVVIDAIDNVTAKMNLIVTCLRERIRIVSAMGAAARLDPTRVRVVDLCDTNVDPFARDIRKSLRKKYGLDATKPTGVVAVYSDELPIVPSSLSYDHDGFECVCPGGQNGLNDCDHRNRIEGSAVFVPAAFGLTAAATAVKMILGQPVLSPKKVRAVRLARLARAAPPSQRSAPGRPEASEEASGGES
jgi:tRNA A37 threonylcarbamoyladenosine dehydratase